MRSHTIEDPCAGLSRHAKDPMRHTKHLMDSAKGRTGGANTGGRGVDVGALRHETVSRIPLSTEEKTVRFHDRGAAAA
jgi:hypothetical protein